MQQSLDRDSPGGALPEGADLSLLREVIDHIPARVVFVDNEHRYRYVNRAFLEFVGLRADEVLGRPAAEILGEALSDVYVPLLPRLAAGEMVWREGWTDYAKHGRRYVHEGLWPYQWGDIPGILAF